MKKTLNFVTILITIISLFGCNSRSKQEKIVVLSFDDATQSHLDIVAPILKEKGFGATFFITHAWMNDTVNFMNWKDVKTLYNMGFEIGNHSWSHTLFESAEAAKLMKYELYRIDSALMAIGIPKPVSFAHPANRFTKETVEELKKLGYRFARRGMQPEIPYGKITMGPLFDAKKHNRLIIPTTADAYPEWDIDYFKSIIDRAEPGKAIILQFHGVPDVAHPWVDTDPDNFILFMNYLEEKNFKVIPFKDIDKYFDVGDVEDPILNGTYQHSKAKY